MGHIVACERGWVQRVHVQTYRRFGAGEGLEGLGRKSHFPNAIGLARHVNLLLSGIEVLVDKSKFLDRSKLVRKGRLIVTRGKAQRCQEFSHNFEDHGDL